MQSRRKLHDMTLNEQDPARDLFAILFLSFYLFLLVTMSLGSSEVNEHQSEPAPEIDMETFSGNEFVSISKKGDKVIYTVGKQEYDWEEFSAVLAELPVFDDNKNIKILASKTMNAIEWERAKMRIHKLGYSIVPLTPAK